MNQIDVYTGDSPTSEWQTGPEDILLKGEEVHTWQSSLDLPCTQIEKLIRTLSPEEKSRSEKFHFRRDRKHFIVARGILRNILARYLATEPEEITFSCNPYGKPFLTGRFRSKKLSFNLSHSHDHALYAVALKRKIGVDLEHPRQSLEWNEIAEKFFSYREQAELQALPEKDRQRAFFTYWTRKEAFLKAEGIGLTADIKKVDIAIKPERTACFLYSNYTSGKGEDWVLLDLNLGFNFVGALAVEGEGFRVQYWKWYDSPEIN